jgi:hypothetical protein
MEKFIPYTLVVISGLARLIPHPWNITPILGMVNYGFVTIKQSYISTLLIIAIMFITDEILHFINAMNPAFGSWMLYMYPIYLLNGFISKAIIQRPNQWVNIGVASILTGFAFWVVSDLCFFLAFYE